MSDKRPWVAFVLSFILPGAGLAYLGKWGWGTVNFLFVNLAILGIFLFAADRGIWDHIHYVFLALAAGSAGLAHGAASSRQTATSSAA